MQSRRSATAPSDKVDQKLAEIATLLAREDFAAVEKLIAELPDIVASFPVSSRESLIKKIQACLQRIRIEASAESERTSARLDALRNGRIAASAYRAAERI
jgi:hypothetical protein